MDRIVHLPLNRLLCSTLFLPPTIPSALAKLFSKITHLDVDQPWFLSYFPSLTHLIIHDDFQDPERYGEALTVLPKLKVLIVHTPGFEIGPAPAIECDTTGNALDPRVVHLDYDIVESWRNSAWGVPQNAWVVAEEIVDERRARALADRDT